MSSDTWTTPPAAAPDPRQPTFLDAFQHLLRTPAFKFFLILFLILLLTIPLAMIYLLISERESRVRSVEYEVGRTWGPEQQILGPVLVVPYTVRRSEVREDKVVTVTQDKRAIFTPATLNVEGNSDVRTLRRGIFEVPAYTADLKLAGRFSRMDVSDIDTDIVSVRWQDAVLSIAISGVAGLKNAAVLSGTGRGDIPFAPSVGYPQGGNLSGIHAPLETLYPLGAAGDAGPVATQASAQGFDFSVALQLNGSVGLNVSPAARETTFALASNWPHPSFSGAFLPDSRDITSAGFDARWAVPHLARSVPEAWVVGNSHLRRLQPHAFGVKLIDPVDFYALVSRAAKYSILFIGLVFMAVFALELLSGRRVHAVQYLFTGVALIFFYVLLLSFAEHIGFDNAYIIAAIATGLMLSIYCAMALSSARTGLIMALVYALTYGLLYLILQLEDYALLAGAILGFLALTAVMFATLRVDWSGSGRADPVEPARA